MYESWICLRCRKERKPPPPPPHRAVAEVHGQLSLPRADLICVGNIRSIAIGYLMTETDDNSLHSHTSPSHS
jgi:hypothetical protein